MLYRFIEWLFDFNKYIWILPNSLDCNMYVTTLKLIKIISYNKILVEYQTYHFDSYYQHLRAFDLKFDFKTRHKYKGFIPIKFKQDYNFDYNNWM